MLARHPRERDEIDIADEPHSVRQRVFQDDLAAAHDRAAGEADPVRQGQIDARCGLEGLEGALHVRVVRYIDVIEPAGEQETLCIQVGAGDSLYTTDDFLLTHNTLNDAFILLDEAQNTTPEQMKMFLTRIGFGSKAVVNGDITQIDLPNGQRSGLKMMEEILTGIDGISFCHLGGRDVVRHKIVQEIVEAYRMFGEQRAARADG